jgi:hypothetical protein
LTGRTPYKFESISLQQRVSDERCRALLPGVDHSTLCQNFTWIFDWMSTRFLCHDDETDACSGTLEMLNPMISGSSRIFDQLKIQLYELPNASA